MEKMPKQINLLLVETDTFYILNLPSKVLDKETPEGEAADSENTRYDYLTLGKGRNRKMVDQVVQTISNIVITREVQKYDTIIQDNLAFASTWDMYDTYKGITNENLKHIQTDDINDILYKCKERMQEKSEDDDEKEMIALVYNQKFLDAVNIIERLLANNNYSEQQKRFRGLSDPAALRENIDFKYRLQLLWTFANDKSQGKSVSCLKWNPANKDVLAAGYGKFHFTDNKNGMVMIWNIKNPIQPERWYTFEAPITSLEFSKDNPNLLAIGFYNGNIKIINISVRYLSVITETTRDSSPSFEAIWQMYFEVNENSNREHIISIGNDGRICKTGPVGPNAMITSEIMRVCKTEGTMKGLKTTKKFVDPAVRVTRYQTALISCKHPNEENMYFVGTTEGSVHKLSKYSYHREVDSFCAHDGPIYQMKFSPFCNKLLMTCGDDWNIRLWAEGINEPILELREHLKSVQGADWSPTHSTIIASICGKNILIWDLQRKVFSYQSLTRSPMNSRNTVVQFTEDGRCLVVGDVNGNIHVFSLEDMPFPAFFQADLLTRSLQRALVAKPENLKRMLRKGPLYYDNLKMT